MLSIEQKNKLKSAGYTDAQIKGYEYKKFGMSSPTKEPSETWQDIKQFGSEIKEEYGKGIAMQEAAQASFEAGEQGRFRTEAQKIGGTALSVSNMFGSFLKGAVKTILPQKQEELVKTGIEKTIQGMTKFGEKITPDVVMDQNVKLIEAYQNASPNVKRDINAVLGVGALGLDIWGVGATTKPITSAPRQIQRVWEGGLDTIRKNTPRVLRKTASELPIEQTAKLSDDLVDLYKKSFIADQPSVVAKLEKYAFRNNTTVDDALATLAKEGFVPEVDGKLAKFTSSIDDIDTRIDRLATNLEPVLQQVPTRTPVTQLVDSAQTFLRNSPDIGTEFNKVVRQIESIGDSLKAKYGETITAKQLVDTLRQLNKSTKAFTREVFEQDADNILAQAVRKQIDDITPQGIGTSVNLEMGRLLQMKELLAILNNKTINVGVLGGQLGRYMGTVLASGAGLSIAGPGGLVIAGIAAHMGGNFVAQLLRKFRFNPNKFRAIINAIKKDDELVERLIKSADGENKEILKRALLPEGAIRLGGKKGESSVKSVTAGKGEPGRTPAGKFKKTFSSTEENQTTFQKIKDKLSGKNIPNKEGGFIRLPFSQKVVKEIDEPTKVELFEALKLLDEKPSKITENQLDLLLQKYEIDPDLSVNKIKKRIEGILDKTKTKPVK